MMRIEIQAKGFLLTEALREHTERRIRFAFSWASGHVRKVMVRLSDINGPRGGNDKRCQIQIPMQSVKDIVVEDTEADLYVAIDRAADRAERTVARKLERGREYKHEKHHQQDKVDSADVIEQE